MMRNDRTLTDYIATQVKIKNSMCNTEPFVVYRVQF